MLTQEGIGLKLIYRRSRAEGELTKTLRSQPRCRHSCQRPPNTKTGTGRRSQPTRTASSGGGFLRPNICLQLGGGWRCARFAIGTVEKIANARGSTSAFLAMISFFVFEWSLMGGEDNVRLSIPTPTTPYSLLVLRTGLWWEPHTLVHHGLRISSNLWRGVQYTTTRTQAMGLNGERVEARAGTRQPCAV